MDMLRRLESNRNALLEQYWANLEVTQELQNTLIRDILPSITDELELSNEALEWARDWLLDTPSIFRISRRNKFTRSFSLEAIRKNLLWRLTNLWPLKPPIAIPNLHCLPPDVRDPFGRPILVIETTPLDANAVEQKKSIIHTFERLRMHLRNLYDASENADSPLQYMIILDLQQLSLHSINIDLFTWTIREVIPRFPGLIAGVCMINYSWTHSGMWSLFRRLLPDSALSRIFFPSKTELVEYFTASALPKHFGGSLPPFPSLYDPLQPNRPPDRTISPTNGQLPYQSQSPVVSWLSSTSILNPFFGYPVSTFPNRSPTFQHGRRRKRDLARTLTLLFWMRWRSGIITAALISTLILLIRFAVRRGDLRFPRYLWMFRSLK